MRSRRRSCKNVKSTVENKLKGQDLFGEQFRMNLDTASHDLRSILGSLCSFMLIIVVCLFAYLKYDVLVNR